MKKASAARPDEDLLPEYDLSKLKGAVRGKYYSRAIADAKKAAARPANRRRGKA